jgi:tRNA (guanine37-N1)-methyltransferase
MVMKAEPIVLAIEAILASAKAEGCEQSRVILLSPGGKLLKQDLVSSYSTLNHAVLICGHYEGIDERAVQLMVDEEVSIGDYVLTGGELPALVWIDSVVRLIPGVLGSDESVNEESFCEDGLLEYPHYTRPREFRGLRVPDVLVSGDHKAVKRWRRGTSLVRTFRKRPDLLENYSFSKEDVKSLAMIDDGKEVLEWKSSRTLK